jgi:hypothetical protein
MTRRTVVVIVVSASAVFRCSIVPASKRLPVAAAGAALISWIVTDPTLINSISIQKVMTKVIPMTKALA